MRIVRILAAAANEAVEAAAWYESERYGLRENGDEIIVIAFAHHARRPGYWRKRVPRS